MHIVFAHGQNQRRIVPDRTHKLDCNATENDSNEIILPKLWHKGGKSACSTFPRRLMSAVQDMMVDTRMDMPGFRFNIYPCCIRLRLHTQDQLAKREFHTYEMMSLSHFIYFTYAPDVGKPYCDSNGKILAGKHFKSNNT
jgi:hypothetical protein